MSRIVMSVSDISDSDIFEFINWESKFSYMLSGSVGKIENFDIDSFSIYETFFSGRYTQEEIISISLIILSKFDRNQSIKFKIYNYIHFIILKSSDNLDLIRMFILQEFIYLMTNMNKSEIYLKNAIFQLLKDEGIGINFDKQEKKATSFLKKHGSSPMILSKKRTFYHIMEPKVITTIFSVLVRSFPEIVNTLFTIVQIENYYNYRNDLLNCLDRFIYALRYMDLKYVSKELINNLEGFTTGYTNKINTETIITLWAITGNTSYISKSHLYKNNKRLQGIISDPTKAKKKLEINRTKKFIEVEDASSITNVKQRPTSGSKEDVYLFIISKNRKRYHLVLQREDTLEDLFYKINEVYEFESMHLWAFFMKKKLWSKPAYYSPDSEKGPFADKIKIFEINFIPKKKLTLLYDFGRHFVLDVYLKEAISTSEYESNYINSDSKNLRLI